MANTGVVYGGDIQLYRTTDGGATWTAFAHSTSHSYQGSTATREVSSKDTGGDTWVKPGKHSPSTISINGLVTYNGVSFYGLEDLRLNRTLITVKYSGRPTGDTLKVDTVEATGDKYLTATGYITEVSREDAHDADSTYSATIILATKPTIATK